MADWLLSIPAFIKIAVSFFGILLLYRMKIPLGISMFVNSLGLMIWAGTGFGRVFRRLRLLLLPENVLLLIAIVALIFFTEALRKTGKMQRTIDALKGIFKKTTVLYAGFPALIGLLPMPGGALFSAPFVKSVDENDSLHSAHKVAINYWFRHIWEYWWPLYPGVILAIKFSQLPPGIYFALQIPFTIVAVAAGYFFILRSIISKKVDNENIVYDTKAVMHTLVPIGALVLFAVAGTWAMKILGSPESLSNIPAILAGLGFSLVLVFFKKTGAIIPTLQIFKQKSLWTIIAVVLGVQLYSVALKTPLGKEGMTLVSLMRDEFLETGIPLVLVIMLVPLISGIITGIAMGFVGASFPLVFALLGESPEFNVIAATTALAFGFGYVGMLLSPVHICFMVTNEYFKSRLIQSYPWLIGPAGVMIVATLCLSALYYTVF
ncbi:MAG: DUF401 family protein [Chitinivibrionales bacterium]|nr:DUF401 family protein [Chitinivibrionales bacterium]